MLQVQEGKKVQQNQIQSCGRCTCQTPEVSCGEHCCYILYVHEAQLDTAIQNVSWKNSKEGGYPAVKNVIGLKSHATWFGIYMIISEYVGYYL